MPTPDITTLRNKFFVQPSDLTGSTTSLPMTFDECKVTVLIDAMAFNAALEAALNITGTTADRSQDFIFIANWWIGLVESAGQPDIPSIASGKLPNVFTSSGPSADDAGAYCLDGPGGTKVLMDILKQKARDGVDVRALGWISFSVMDSAIGMFVGKDISPINARTMNSIQRLREEPAMAKKALLNTISHSAGAVHAKLIVIGNATEAIGFTGGLDLASGRWASPIHSPSMNWHGCGRESGRPSRTGVSQPVHPDVDREYFQTCQKIQF